ncbi:MAG TPA: alpha/beta hydrolase [Gemmatimonadales bacterium]|nr:alpha/beta hydrolase [Gemmatimonadales bacterium]
MADDVGDAGVSEAAGARGVTGRGGGPLVHDEGRFRSADGLALHWRRWRDPAAPTVGVLVNLHGLGDHSGLYPMVADWFAPRGWPVYAMDLRGNGRSEGQRGYVARWREFRRDLATFLALVRAHEPDGPCVVMGSSLGGLVALDFALETSGAGAGAGALALAGVVAVAPPLGALGVPPVLMALGRVLSRLWPRFSLEAGMDLSGLARDPRIVEAVLADPLFHRRGTARLSTEVTATIARVQAGAARITTPLLLLHGAADRMVPPDGSRAFVARARTRPGADVAYLEYPEGYHALLADLDGARVLADVAAWLAARA